MTLSNTEGAIYSPACNYERKLSVTAVKSQVAV